MFSLVPAPSFRGAFANGALAVAALFLAGCGNGTGSDLQFTPAAGGATAETASTGTAQLAAAPAAFNITSFSASIAADTDGDGSDDSVDNCTAVANPDQRDNNGDGFGNLCDADLNNNGIVDSQDLALLKAAFGSPGFPDYDINGNGIVDSYDSAIAKVALGQPPGPATSIDPPVASLYPLRTEAGKRYLVDAQGNPFFLSGDTAWSLIVQLSLADAEVYLENRRQNGLNTVLVNLIESTYGDNVPGNRAGDDPFLGSNYTNFNEAYFAHAAAVIGLAASKGMLVLLTPSYMGYQGNVEGWYQQMRAAGATRLRNYGRYLGSRLAGKDNIMWVHGGDFDPPNEGVLLARALAEGIIEMDPSRRWLHTVHADRNTSALDSSLGNEPWMTMNVIYTSDSTVVAEAYDAWTTTSLPFFLFEAYYEDGDDGDFIRKMAYQSTLSGASGHLMGHNSVWRFYSGWKDYLNSDGALSMPHIKSLLTTRAWWLLVPDTGATFLTGGVNPGPHQAPAALASDRSFGLIYVQEYRQLTVNMSQLAGPRVKARWFDPASGDYSTITGSPFSANGSRTFPHPRDNSRGDEDWVLVLESSP